MGPFASKVTPAQKGFTPITPINSGVMFSSYMLWINTEIMTENLAQRLIHSCCLRLASQALANFDLII